MNENGNKPRYQKGLKRTTAHTITLEEYRALEAAGKIKRPLTDYPMEVRKHQMETIFPKKVSPIDAVIADQDRD